MDNSDVYKTIKSPSEGLFKDKGSKFIAKAFPVIDEHEVKKHLEDIRKYYHDARHHCFAYIIGRDQTVWRANDDGEPSGTAGKPIMGQIKSFGLTNVLIVVIRYFGGTLLGVSGLINAYKTAAEDALKNAQITDHVVNQYYELSFPYMAINDVMKIIKEEDIKQGKSRFELDCSMIINFRESAMKKILDRFSRIDGLNYRLIETR